MRVLSLLYKKSRMGLRWDRNGAGCILEQMSTQWVACHVADYFVLWSSSRFICSDSSNEEGWDVDSGVLPQALESGWVSVTRTRQVRCRSWKVLLPQVEYHPDEEQLALKIEKGYSMVPWGHFLRLVVVLVSVELKNSRMLDSYWSLNSNALKET